MPAVIAISLSDLPVTLQPVAPLRHGSALALTRRVEKGGRGEEEHANSLETGAFPDSASIEAAIAGVTNCSVLAPAAVSGSPPFPSR